MMRAILGLVLYVTAGFLAFFALGASMSEPGEHVTKPELISQAQALLAGAAVAAWTAGVLWLGGIVDALWKIGSSQRAPAIIFIVLGLVFALPWGLLQTLGETRTLSDLQVVSWALAPPCLIIAVLRFAGIGGRARPASATPAE